MSTRSKRVLAEPDPAVAIKLKSNPGQWYAVQSGGLDRRHTFAQVAYRIRKGKQKAFRCAAGTFEATVHTEHNSAGDPAELRVRYVPDAYGSPQ